MPKLSLFLLTCTILLSSCSSVTVPPSATATLSPAPPTSSPTETPIPPTPTEVPTPTKIPVEWSILTDEQRHIEAPDTYITHDRVVLSESNTSTIYNNLIIYRDESGEAVKTFDGKKFVDLQDSIRPGVGIIELHLNDGTKWERPLFTPVMRENDPDEKIESAQIKAMVNAVDYMMKHNLAWGKLWPRTIDDMNQVDIDLEFRIYKILEKTHDPIDIIFLPFFSVHESPWMDQGNKFYISSYKLLLSEEEGSLIVFKTVEGSDALVVGKGITPYRLYDLADKIPIPPKPQP